MAVDHEADSLFRITVPFPTMRASIRRTLVVCAAYAVAALRADAQRNALAGAYATRSELESVASECASRAKDETRDPAERSQSMDEEQALRERLRVGDFRVGDRIVLHITGAAWALDTVSVTARRALLIRDAGDITLEGVLRSELQEHLNTQVARYLRNAVVRAEPLTRLAVLGEVRTPGFVYVPSQSLLSDVISAAGGPTVSGSLDRATLRRSGRTLVSSAGFSKALVSGATLDDLGVRAGDEIVVEPKRTFHWTPMLQVGAVILGSVSTLIALQHR